MTIFFAILKLLSGLGVFIYGMNILSDSMKKLTDTGLKTLLSKTSNSKLAGVGIGTVTTAIAQSSSVTTVMVVGLVNAGMLTLYQATAMIMGANIGTTITGQIVALKSLPITEFALSLTFIGVFMNMFSKKDKTKTIAMVLAGLGLIFVGLEFMSMSMSDFSESQYVKDLLHRINNPFLLLFIGVAFTAIVQSSSAVTGIIITMVGGGLTIGSGGNAVLFVILGSNIGTCVTALLSSIGTGTNARRASIIHLMFNVFGSLIFMIMLLIWKDFYAVTFQSWFGMAGTQIAMFHTFFNVLCVAIFLPFTKYFVKLAEIIVKDKKVVPLPKYVDMDERLINTPSLALSQLYKEAGNMLGVSMDAMTSAFNGFIEKKRDYDKIVDEKIDEVSNMDKEITNYLVKISACDVNLSDEKLISALHYVLNDVTRIGELANNFTKYTRHYVEDELVFSDEVLLALQEMYGKITNLYELTKMAYTVRDKQLLKEIDALEDKIDTDRRELVDNHIVRLKEGKCQPQSSGIFINLVGNLERAADHITFIAHSID